MTLNDLTDFAVLASFIAGLLSAMFAAIYRFLIIPKLNAHIDAAIDPIKADLAEILRNGHQNPDDPSIRDQLSTLVGLWTEHVKVSDADRNRLAALEAKS